MLKNKVIKEETVKQRFLTVLEAMIKLKEVRVIPVKFKEKTFWISTDITGDTADVFKAIGIKIPSKQLKVE